MKTLRYVEAREVEDVIVRLAREELRNRVRAGAYVIPEHAARMLGQAEGMAYALHWLEDLTLTEEES